MLGFWSCGVGYGCVVGILSAAVVERGLVVRVSVLHKLNVDGFRQFRRPRRLVANIK